MSPLAAANGLCFCVGVVEIEIKSEKILTAERAENGRGERREKVVALSRRLLLGHAVHGAESPN